MEINLLDSYPNLDRDTKLRNKTKTISKIKCAKKFGWEYFDKKGVCYDSYTYDGRWVSIANRLIQYYNLDIGSKILDIGCAKGYLVYDLVDLGMDAYGIDISKYGVDCSPPEIRWRLKVNDARDLNTYKNDQFDLVISINTLHNLNEKDCRNAIKQIERIGKNAFIVVDSYRSIEERERMMAWNITGETIKSTSEWEVLFKEEKYNGDYYWFIP